ncbi:MAG: hypothetical protein J5835_06950, partial [Bacteroidales bacterium]|nr:hypothetical protein [Bacteroidales bacterium]
DTSQHALFDLASGDGTKNAVFSGTLDFSASSYDVSIYNGDGAFNYSTQIQPSDGVTTHLKYFASASGVAPSALTNEGNIVFTSFSSVLAITAKMPSTEVAAQIMSVDITASANIFSAGNTLTIRLDEAGDAGSDGILHLFASLPQGDQAIAAGTSLFVKFNAPGTAHTVYTRYIELPAQTFTNQKLNTININATQSDKHAGLISSEGTSTNPYLIADGYQLQALDGLLAEKTAETTVYAELIDDIDLSVYDNWSPIDASTRFINLEGNNHTVSKLKITSPASYAGLFKILYGTVKNLTISDADVKGNGSNGSGILAGYLCSTTGAADCTIDNVTIKDSKLDGNAKVCGAIASSIGQNASNTFAISISNVTVSGTTVTTTNDCGGLIALAQGASSTNRTLTISKCKVVNSSISSTGTSIRVGGIVGVLPCANTTISDIDVKGTNVSGLSKAKAVGGIVGLVSNSAIFEKCTYENNADDPNDVKSATITGPTQHDGTAATSQTAYGPGSAYVGGIAGEVSGAASFDDCHVKGVTLTVTNPTSNTSYWKNVGGAFGYIHNNGAIVGNSSQCTVENVSIPAHHFAAGFVSALSGGSINNSTVTGLAISGQNFVGGFVSLVNAGTIIDCSVAGNTIQSANATLGGFASYVYGEATMTRDTTSLQIGDATHKLGANTGGFAGQIIASATITDCHATGSVYTASNSTYVGGFAGTINAACNISKCSATGSVEGGKYLGGFTGSAKAPSEKTLSISECYYSAGTVTSTTTGSDSYVGGLIGLTYEAGTVNVTNCYVSGNVTGPGKWAGGILGSHYKGSANLTNCYVTGSVTAGIGAGGIVGHVNAAGLSVVRCMAFNSGIHATNNDGSEHESSGAVIGYANGKKLVCNVSYRISSMASRFSDCTGNSANVIEQHSFISSANTIPQRQGLTYGYYHHGRNTSYTLCNLVHSGAIGEDWSNEIWDWSGDRPVLQNNKETL